MGEFVREASAASIILVVLGAVLVIVVTPSLHVLRHRRRASGTATSEDGPPVFPREEKPSVVSRPFARVIRADTPGWIKIAIGRPLWIFD